MRFSWSSTVAESGRLIFIGMANANQVVQVGQILGRRWVIEGLLGAGGFGCVYEARDLYTHERCAVKVEPMDVEKPVLKMEIAVLQRLNQVTEHACQLLGYGRVDNDATFIAMTLLGSNLYDLQRSLKARRFAAHTVARLALQCLEAIAWLHNVGFIHRDIKPANFVTGLSPPANRIVHMVDFGLARRHFLPGTETVIPPRAFCGFRGTIRYAPIAAHCSQDLGRRDDICSLLYVLVEFRLGRLPWRDIENENQVRKMKLQMGWQMPQMEWPYRRIAEQVYRLKYAEQPDYHAYAEMIRRMQVDHGYEKEGPFEWET